YRRLCFVFPHARAFFLFWIFFWIHGHMVRAHVRAFLCRYFLDHRRIVRAFLCRIIVDDVSVCGGWVYRMPWTQDRVDVAQILAWLFLAFNRIMPLGFQRFDTPLDMALCDACLVGNREDGGVGIAAFVIGIIGKTQQDKLLMTFGLTVGSDV